VKRVENFKYYYKQATKPVTLVALAVGFVGVLIGAAGLFAGAYYNKLYQNAVAEKQAVAGTVLHAEGDVTSPLQQNAQQNAGFYPVAYQVAEGDSLWKITEQFYGDGNLYTFLAKENGITTPNHLAVGTELSIPTPPQEKEAMGSNEAKAEKETDSYQNSSDNIVKSGLTNGSASSSDRENFEHFEYVVECGDSLWFIALKYYGDGYRWTEIYTANKTTIGNNPNLIFPETKLDL
jgi:nucleoid-associated protein YgaU